MSKFTDEDVMFIRSVYKHGSTTGSTPYSGHKLAKMYGVSKTLIYRIVKGTAWVHVK